MNPNKVVTIRIALLAIACGLLIFNCISYQFKQKHKWSCDFIYRYNEIACMHEGIDPFDIFERKITTEKFRGIKRPDKNDEPQDSRRIVHAYPAWHAAVFWWYGYAPRQICLAFLVFLYICSLALCCKWFSMNLPQTDALDYATSIFFLLTMFLDPLSGLVNSMNYGLVILGWTLLLYFALDSNHNILAGVIYSFIMIKPQIGILLFFPLLFNRKYKTIAFAVAICLIETCFTSCMLHKSPVELILQIPKIGAPFDKGFLAETTMKIVGPIGQYLVMGVFICLAAGGSYLVRNAKEAWVRFLPALASIPFWTYSQSHDWLVTLPCYVYILNNKEKYTRMVECCYFAAILWSFTFFAHTHEWYSIGKVGTYSFLHLFILSSCCLMSILNHDENERIHKLFGKLLSLRRIKKPECL